MLDHTATPPMPSHALCAQQTPIPKPILPPHAPPVLLVHTAMAMRHHAPTARQALTFHPSTCRASLAPQDHTLPQLA